MQAGKYAAAASTLAPLAVRRCDFRASLLLAAAYEGSGDPRRAEQALEAAHAAWPTNNSVAASLAREYLAGRETEKAAEALDRFRPTPSTPPQELELATIVFLTSHRLVPGEAAARAAFAGYPSLHTLLLLANTLQLEGRYKDVLTLLGDKRAAYGQEPPFLVTLAESEYDAKIFDAARTDLEDAVALAPKLPQAHYLLGNVLLAANETDKAVGEYRRAIELAPDQPRTYYQLALALRAKEDESGEESALKEALAIDPRFALAHSELGRLLVNQNRLPEAETQLKLSIEDNAKSEQAYYLLAKVYDRLGEADKSRETAKRLAALRKVNHGEAPDGFESR